MTQAVLSNLDKLAKIVSKIHRKHASGQLLCSTRQVRLTLHFYRGRLLWLTDDRDHRIRRWLRVTKGHLKSRDSLQVPRTFEKQDLWENKALSRHILDGVLTSDAASAILKRTVAETLFAIDNQEPVSCHWRAKSVDANIE
ncbi:MAG: hypothetical protein AAF889_08940, partial [Cyanobacteria bacterium P01_D01_bin.73]